MHFTLLKATRRKKQENTNLLTLVRVRVGDLAAKTAIKRKQSDQNAINKGTSWNSVKAERKVCASG